MLLDADNSAGYNSGRKPWRHLENCECPAVIISTAIYPHKDAEIPLAAHVL